MRTQNPKHKEDPFTKKGFSKVRQYLIIPSHLPMMKSLLEEWLLSLSKYCNN